MIQIRLFDQRKLSSFDKNVESRRTPGNLAQLYIDDTNSKKCLY